MGGGGGGATRFFPMLILGIPMGGIGKNRHKSEKNKNDPIIPAVVCSYTLECYIFIALIYYQCKVNKFGIFELISSIFSKNGCPVIRISELFHEQLRYVILMRFEMK